MSIRVTDNPAESRFEIFDGEELAGFADYRRSGDRITLTHTEIAERFGGQGLGSTLVEAALTAAREQGLRVLPVCPFVRSWIARHPDFASLVPEEQHARFGL